jgi:CubicO group peptidase (beta-lactamase class C family)
MENGKGLGLGWEISRDGEILFHGGATGGYRAWMAVAPRHNVGIVVLANSAHVRIYKFGDALIHIALGGVRTELPEPADVETETSQ